LAGLGKSLFHGNHEIKKPTVDLDETVHMLTDGDTITPSGIAMGISHGTNPARGINTNGKEA
jgi:hypothetical protein